MYLKFKIPLILFVIIINLYSVNKKYELKLKKLRNIIPILSYMTFVKFRYWSDKI